MTRAVKIERVVPDISFKKRILCVEDNCETFELIAAILVEYEVHAAKTLEEARSLLAGQKYSLIVLDYRMPDGDGLSFCREIRRGSILTPIIFVTGDPRMSEADVRVAGGQRLIEKDSLRFVDDLLSETDSLSVSIA